jgi:hypothetical protein
MKKVVAGRCVDRELVYPPKRTTERRNFETIEDSLKSIQVRSDVFISKTTEMKYFPQR